METLACRDRPWPDLLDPLLENILERLPLSGYVRFSAVCRRWRSVENSHRRRHSPSPPPMLRLPWLISWEPRHQGTLSCYSPFEDKFFTFPVPFPFEDRPFSSHLPFFPLSFGSLDRGWLLSRDSGNLVHWNPVSVDKVELPQLIYARDVPLLRDGVVAISPPPHYLVSIARRSAISLLLWFDSDWVQLKLPAVAAWRGFERTVCIGGKHYRTLSIRARDRRVVSHDLLVVDALATPPTLQFFEMAALRWTAVDSLPGNAHLVEFGEELLLVKEIVHDLMTFLILRFEVYRADLDRNMWVKVESVGDNRVILIHRFQSVSLLAADIGARGNCIYFTSNVNRGPRRWKVFDLGTGRRTDFQLRNVQNELLFVPSLC